MSDSPEPTWPGTPEVEALVSRVVAERIDPLRAQLASVGRALALLAERVPPPEQVGQLAAQLGALATRVDATAPAAGSLLDLERTVNGGLAEMAQRLDELVARFEGSASHPAPSPGPLGDLPAAVASAVEQGLAKIEAARAADGDDLAQALARIEAARAADASRIVELVSALEAPLQRESGERRSQTDELRQALAVAVSHAVAKIDQARNADAATLHERVATLADALAAETEARAAQATELPSGVVDAIDQAISRAEASRTADSSRLLEQVATLAEALARDAEGREAEADQLRASVASTLDRAIAEIEAARTADTTRVLEQVASLEGPLTRDAIARQAQLDDLRHTVVITMERAVSRIEAERAADAALFLEQVTGLVDKAEGEAQRRDAQAKALLAAVDERLQALHLAGDEAGAAREARLAARLEAVTAEHGSALMARIDERTAAITHLESIPPLVAAEVHDATAAALTSEVQPLVARLVEAIDTLAHEAGRIEAMARGHAGEARAVEDRIATLFVDVAERAESAVDHSRARIAEGQVALSNRLDAVMGEMMTSVSAAADRLEARLADSAESLRAAGSHQNGALLDAVNHSRQQLSEGLTEVRSGLVALGAETATRGTGADRADSVIERLDALRATVERIRGDPRIEALVVEQVAAREAQLTAIEAVSSRIDEVGPVVARALLSEVERAVRAANAAEEAVSSLRPEALRSLLGEAADDIRSAATRLDETISSLADQVGLGLAALADSQAGISAPLVEGQPAEQAGTGRIEELNRALGEAVATLSEAITGSRDELLTITTRALERSTALADEVATASGTALEDLRASQTVLRAAVQDGAHKAELAALDIRGLRDRLTPHLVALADATTRRAEADQAGFDAVLARLDQLLATRQG